MKLKIHCGHYIEKSYKQVGFLPGITIFITELSANIIFDWLCFYFEISYEGEQK